MSKMKAFSAIVAILLLGATSAENVTFSCIDGEPPNYITVQVFNDGVECTESPCKLKRGTEVDGTITFITAKSVEKITKLAVATLQGVGIDVPYPLPGAEEGCEDLINGSYCPLDKGETAALSFSMPILPEYPKISLKVKISLVDEAKDEITCFAFFMDVVD